MYWIMHGYMTAYLRAYTLQHEGKYREALTLVDTLPKALAEAQTIQKGLLPPDPDWVLKEGFSLADLQTHLKWQADRAGGQLGDLLGRAPAKAQFLQDPKNIGLFEQWQRDDIGAKQKWQPIDLTRHWGLNGQRDTTGGDYEGIGWYRIAIPIKQPGKGRAQLVMPLVFTERAWVWVNGQLVASPTNMTADEKTGPVPGKGVLDNNRGYVTLSVDIQDQLRPNAANTVVVRLIGTFDRTQRRGIAEVPFVWAPNK